MDVWPSEEVSCKVRLDDPDTNVATVGTAPTASIHGPVNEPAANTSPSNGQLFPEILCLIFRYLDVPDRGRVARVCRYWNDVIDDRSIWSCVEAKLRLPDVSPFLYNSLNRRGISKIKVISFKGGLRELLQALPGLTSLDVSECYNITDSCIVQSFLKPFPSLVSLNLSQCSEVTDVSAACVATFLSNLECLYLAGCEKITDTGMILIAANLYFLKFLEVKECAISNAALKHLAGIAGTSDSFQRPGVNALEYLGLEGCDLVSDVGLEYVRLGLKNLVTLDLSMCLSVTDAGLEHIAMIASLKKLILFECDEITEQGMFYLATAQFRLNCLILSYCDQIEDPGIEMISRGQGLLSLTALNITACPITDVGLSIVADKLRDLTSLNISECESISNDGIGMLASNLRNLRFINVRHCTRLTNLTLMHLATMSTLEIINMKGCARITGRGMAFMVSDQGQSSVLELDVSFTSIGDMGLRYIAQGMQKLRSLSLCGCMISDKGISRVARCLHDLITLRMSRCNRITDTGIKVVGRHLSHLRQIDLKGCSRITSAGKRSLAVRLPHLEFL